MRFRSKGELSESVYVRQDFPYGQSPSAPVTVKSGRHSGGTLETITDIVTPRFDKLSAQGSVIMSPVVKTKTIRSGSPVSWTFTYPYPAWGTRKYDGDVVCEHSVPPTRPTWFTGRISDAQGYTLVKAFAKMSQPDVLSLVSVAESEKTAKMLLRPFAAVDDLIKRIARKKATLLKAGMNLTLAAANAWNEYRFGWKPLLYDIQGIADAYAKSGVHIRERVRKVARSSDNVVAVWSQLSQPTVGGLTGYKTMGNFAHGVKVSSGVLFELSDESQASANQRHLGLRLSDVPATVWELVPFSFVVDRFSIVGEWLNAITPVPGLTVLGNWTTTVDKQANHHQCIDAWIDVQVPPYALASLHNQGGSYDEIIESYSRTVNNVLPALPPLNVKELSLNQTIDHYALLAQKLGNLWHH